MLYDDDNFYVVCRCWDSAPPEQWVANDMRRDSQRLRDNDNFGVSLDTYHDRRNAFVFYTTPLGALTDQTYTDEGNPNRDWNQVWDVRTGRFEGGWTAEIAIPFKSLRYAPGRSQTWGIQIRRGIRRKNEWTHLTVLPPASGGSQAWFRVSGSATLVGLEAPPASRNIEIKPYVSARSTTDRQASPPVTNDGDADVGGDLKYGITPNLTADFTYNTDFAQVEVDEQQVNLTRFALSFPEKRDFFLEGRGIFEFGRGVATGGGGGGDSVAPTLFYSRRIGLNRGRVIPIDVGGRMTGRVGHVQHRAARHPDRRRRGLGHAGHQLRGGARQARHPAAQQHRRDLHEPVGFGDGPRLQPDLRRGRGVRLLREPVVGRLFREDEHAGRRRATTSVTRDGSTTTAIGTARAPSTSGSATTSTRRSGSSAATTSRAASDRPRFSPRPQSIDWVRQFRWQGDFEYLENGAGQLETRNLRGSFNIEMETSDEIGFEATRHYEMLIAPFQVAPGVFIPPGSYDFADAQVRYLLGNQRRVSGELTLQHGGFYDGTLTAVWLQHGPRLGDRAALGRAGHLHQLHRPAVRELHHPGASRARPTTRSRRACSPAACSSTRRTTACSAPTCASDGNTARAASSSSSTPTSATRFPGARRY